MPQTPHARSSIGSTWPTSSTAEVAAVFLRLPVVVRITGLSRSTLYRLIADKQFPRPVQLGPRAVAWRRDDVQAWTETRPVTRH